MDSISTPYCAKTIISAPLGLDHGTKQLPTPQLPPRRAHATNRHPRIKYNLLFPENIFLETERFCLVVLKDPITLSTTGHVRILPNPIKIVQ